MARYLFLLFAAVWTVLLQSQPVISINSNDSLPEQFKGALSKYCPNGNCWVGYSIQWNDKRRIMIGSFYCNDVFNDVSLKDIIMNTQRAQDFESFISKRGRKSGSGTTFITNYSISINNKQETDKETAILFLYDKNSRSIDDFLEVGICNLSSNFDLQGYPLVWLGLQDNRKSLNFVLSDFSTATELHTKKALAAAIGIHTGQHEVTAFLTKLITSQEETDLRKDAAFWLGLQNNREALSVLKRIAVSDDILEVCKNAVWGIAYIELPGALDDLIDIAKHNSRNELRKNAIYVLGNKAVRKAEEALKDFIDNDPDVEIKKTAVYALANNSDDNIPYLINIAKTNPSLAIRKCAIYSLSNSCDERALNALIDLAKQ
jgi:HEAT repeats